LNNLDLFIIIPILYGAYKGYRRGIIVEGVSILAFVISVMIGFKFLNESMGFLSPYLTNPITQRILPYIGFAVLFFPIIFLINKLGWLLRSSTKATILGNFDSLLGATFGTLTWALDYYFNWH
jgi:membrane protein required for colicin V production